MSKRINQPVQVDLVRDPDWDALRPSAFRWRRGRFIVKQILDRWEETGRWWEQEVQLTVWRVMCTDNWVYELAVAHKQPPEWRLLTAFD